MAYFYNQASLSFGGSTTNSNITRTEIVSGLQITKTAVTDEYCPGGGGITYVVTLTNTGSITKVTDIVDDLGAYTVGENTFVPLKYAEGSVLYYQNGVLQPTPVIETGEELIIKDITVPAGGTVTVIYGTQTTEYAPLSLGSVITNTATSTGCADGTEMASATVPVRETQQLTIAKAVCPTDTVEDCNVTYTFILQNLGNAPVVATDNVVVKDVFDPKLYDITVTLNDEVLIEGTGYTYDETTGEFTTTEGTITIPAATFVQDPETGEITTTPGVTIITVKGTFKEQ